MSWGNFEPPQVPAFDPAQGDLGIEHGLPANQLADRSQGAPASPVDAGAKLKAAGWMQCPTQKTPQGKPCGYWISPQAKAAIEAHNGYFTCPKCQHSYDLLEELPDHSVSDAEEAFGGTDFRSGGGTRIGIPMPDQGQIGENLVAKMGEIPGYGAITWWHPGGANAQSPLDGSTKEWGIEVKTINYDAIHHRFNPDDGSGSRVFESKNNAAREMGLKGILGILVMLDYRRDVADIYVKEMPLEPWQFRPGRWVEGVARFRKNSASKLVSEVPFENPFKDPNNPSPVAYKAQDYYQQPKPFMPGQSQAPESEPAPF